jgi:hypothetical protein
LPEAISAFFKINETEVVGQAVFSKQPTHVSLFVPIVVKSTSFIFKMG